MSLLNQIPGYAPQPASSVEVGVGTSGRLPTEMDIPATVVSAIPYAEENADEHQLFDRRWLRRRVRDGSLKLFAVDASQTDATDKKIAEKKKIREMGPEETKSPGGASI